MLIKKCKRQILLGIIFKIYYVYSLMVVLEKNREYCISKDVTAGDLIKASYMVSGEKEDSIQIQLKENNFILLYTNKKAKDIYKDNDDISHEVNFNCKKFYKLVSII